MRRTTACRRSWRTHPQRQQASASTAGRNQPTSVCGKTGRRPASRLPARSAATAHAALRSRDDRGVGLRLAGTRSPRSAASHRRPDTTSDTSAMAAKAQFTWNMPVITSASPRKLAVPGMASAAAKNTAKGGGEGRRGSFAARPTRAGRGCRLRCCSAPISRNSAEEEKACATISDARTRQREMHAAADAHQHDAHNARWRCRRSAASRRTARRPGSRHRRRRRPPAPCRRAPAPSGPRGRAAGGNRNNP